MAPSLLRLHHVRTYFKTKKHKSFSCGVYMFVIRFTFSWDVGVFLVLGLGVRSYGENGRPCLASATSFMFMGCWGV